MSLECARQVGHVYESSRLLHSARHLLPGMACKNVLYQHSMTGNYAAYFLAALNSFSNLCFYKRIFLFEDFYT